MRVSRSRMAMGTDNSKKKGKVEYIEAERYNQMQEERIVVFGRLW